MGQMAESAKKAEEELKKSRAKMERDNHAHMEALAKVQPEPTIEDLQRAMGVTVRNLEAVEHKTSEPKSESDKGGYNTRASRPTLTAVRDEKDKDAASKK